MRRLRPSLVASTLAALAVAFVGCGDPVSDRVGADDSRSSAAFGADDRIAVETLAARVESVDATTTPNVVSVAATLPWPTIELDNGTFDDTVVALRVTNIGATARFRPTVRPLASGARRDPRCSDVVIGGSTTFADLERLDSLDDPNDTTVRVTLPACAGVTLDVALAAADTTAEVAIVGSADGQTAWLREAIAAAEDRDVDLLYVIGGADDGDANPYDAVQALAASARVPVAVGFGRSDRELAASWRRAFAPTNNHVRIGDVDLVTLDSSEGRLDARQRELVDDLGRGERTAFVIMAIPPFDPGGVDRYGWRSPVQAAAFVQLLASRGVDAVFASSHARDAERTVGGVDVLNLGGARASDRAWVRVVIDTPHARVAACDRDTPCERGDRCVSGWCRPTCVDDADCDATSTCDVGRNTCRPACGLACDADACDADGWCIDTPRLDIIRESFAAP